MTIIELQGATVYLEPIGSEGVKACEERVISKIFGREAIKSNTPEGVPFILFPDGRKQPVSISHCATVLAVAIAEGHYAIGVDVETPRLQLLRVAPRVLSAQELENYNTLELYLQAWTLKEALYKCALTPGIDFRRDIVLPPPGGTQAIAAHRTCRILYSAPVNGAFMSVVMEIN